MNRIDNACFSRPQSSPVLVINWMEELSGVQVKVRINEPHAGSAGSKREDDSQRVYRAAFSRKKEIERERQWVSEAIFTRVSYPDAALRASENVLAILLDELALQGGDSDEIGQRLVVEVLAA